MSCSVYMVQEERGQSICPERKFANYKKPSTGELFSALTYYVLNGQDNGASGSMPSDQQLITEGIKSAIGSIPELQTLIDSSGELAVEAREQIHKLVANGVLVERNGRYEFGEKQKAMDTFGSLPTILFTSDGIGILKEVAKTAQSVWSAKES